MVFAYLFKHLFLFYVSITISLLSITNSYYFFILLYLVACKKIFSDKTVFYKILTKMKYNKFIEFPTVKKCKKKTKKKKQPSKKTFCRCKTFLCFTRPFFTSSFSIFSFFSYFQLIFFVFFLTFDPIHFINFNYFRINLIKIYRSYI